MQIVNNHGKLVRWALIPAQYGKVANFTGNVEQVGPGQVIIDSDWFGRYSESEASRIAGGDVGGLQTCESVAASARIPKLLVVVMGCVLTCLHVAPAADAGIGQSGFLQLVCALQDSR